MPPAALTKIDSRLCLHFVLHFPFPYDRGSSFSVMITDSGRLHCWPRSSSSTVSLLFLLHFLPLSILEPFPSLSSCFTYVHVSSPPCNFYRSIPPFLDLFHFSLSFYIFLLFSIPAPFPSLSSCYFPSFMSPIFSVISTTYY